MVSCKSLIFSMLLCLALWTTSVESFVVTNGMKGLTRLSTARSFSPRRTVTMYVPPSSPTSQTPPMSAQKLLLTQGVATKRNEKRNASPLALSPSVLASCDTLPSFQTAHGLLSPETVMRLERMTSDGHRSKPLDTFLTAYKRDGPMSCLTMLSDPDILPHLTSAMRDLL